MLLYYLHVDRYFRNWFYHRIGPMMEMLIGWWRSGDRLMFVSSVWFISVIMLRLV